MREPAGCWLTSLLRYRKPGSPARAWRVRRAWWLVQCCMLDGTLKTDGLLVLARRKPQRYPQVSRGFATTPGAKRHGFKCRIACNTALDIGRVSASREGKKPEFPKAVFVHRRSRLWL